MVARACRSPAGAASTAIVRVRALHRSPRGAVAAGDRMADRAARLGCQAASRRLLVAAGYFALFAILLAQALSGSRCSRRRARSRSRSACGLSCRSPGRSSSPARASRRRPAARSVRGVAMTIEGLFSACNMIAMAGWILLLAVPQESARDDDRGNRRSRCCWRRSTWRCSCCNARGSRGGFSSLAACRAALRQPLAAAGRLGALPGLRSVHRRLGNRAMRWPAVPARLLLAPCLLADVHARTDRAALLPRVRALVRTQAARCRVLPASGEGSLRESLRPAARERRRRRRRARRPAHRLSTTAGVDRCMP